MSENGQRDHFFDNLRLFLIFLVALHHGLETAHASSDVLVLIHKGIMSFMMPCFVLLTGYFSKNMDRFTPRNVAKIVSLVGLYTLTQLIKMGLAGSDSFLYPQYGNWYLVGMVIWYATLPIISQFKAIATIPIAMLASVLLAFDPGIEGILQISRVVAFFPFFLIGYYLPKERALMLESRKARWIQVVVLLVLMLLVLPTWVQYVPMGILSGTDGYESMDLAAVEGIAFRIAWYGLAVLLSGAVLCLIPRKRLWFTVYGTRTLSIYVFHMIIYLWVKENTELFDVIAQSSHTIVMFALLSILMIVVCGNKWMNDLLNRWMSMDYAGWRRSSKNVAAKNIM